MGDQSEGWRELTLGERGVLDHLLAQDFGGRDALQAQLMSARVRVIDDGDGSLEFQVTGAKAAVSSRIPVEGRYLDGPNFVPVEILLHVIDGKVDELEVYRADGEAFGRHPFEIDVTEIEVWAKR